MGLLKKPRKKCSPFAFPSDCSQKIVMRKILPLLICLGGFASAQKVKVEDLYANFCSGCHGKNFEGGQGGVLVDGVWKHGGTDADLYRSISEGNLQLGMNPWKTVLTPDQIRSLIIFLREKEKETLAKGVSYPVPSPDKVTKTELHDYRIETLVEKGLKDPWAIAFLPDGRKLVTEKAGRLRFLDKEGKLDPTVIEGTPPVIEHGQGGLMEVALHPDFRKNGWVYLGLSDGTREKTADGKEDVRCITAVVRGRIKDHQWTDQQWIYRPDPKFRSNAGIHFGTRFVFDKGYIYFVIGERGGLMQAQDLSRPNGKIHRLYDDGRVPKDNPFVNTKDAIPSIWSYGHRNPQGLAMDPRDGSLYDTEHGPRGGDEFNLIKPGANYGWPVITLGMNYDGMPMSYPGPDGQTVLSLTEKEGMEQPLAFWVPSIATCGLDFYTGDKFPKWKNDAFAGALAQQEIRRIHIEDRKVISQEIILKNIGRVRDVTTGPDGFIYVILNGPDRVVRLVPAPN
jgi:aldose sugar dehydrogenase